MPRKMPKADDVKTNGKFDKKKFQDSLPAAMDAMASGETKIHKVTVWAGDDGKPHVEIHRTHSHSKGGLPAKIATDLGTLLAGYIVDGTVTVGGYDEAGSETDTLTIAAA